MSKNISIIAPYTEQPELLSILNGKIMKEPDGLSLKKIVLHLDGKSMTFQRVGPANSDELNELSELDKKDLIKIMVIDTSASLIADKGAAQKLIHDLSNNDYISSYHNMVQGFERSWLKGDWVDEVMIQAQSLERSVISYFAWLWRNIEIHIVARLIENPASVWGQPTAGETNQAIYEWLDHERNLTRPFFVFINYMDAHFPYDPDDETARLFLDEEELEDKALDAPSADDSDAAAPAPSPSDLDEPNPESSGE